MNIENLHISSDKFVTASHPSNFYCKSHAFHATQLINIYTINPPMLWWCNWLWKLNCVPDRCSNKIKFPWCSTWNKWILEMSIIIVMALPHPLSCETCWELMNWYTETIKQFRTPSNNFRSLIFLNEVLNWIFHKLEFEHICWIIF